MPAMIRRLPLVLLALLVLVAARPPGAAAQTRSCVRGGAQLEAVAGKVRVVRVEERPRRGETRRQRLLGCWVPTGRRFTLAQERDLGADLRTRTRIAIVEERFVGVIVHYEGGVSETVRAAVWDARTRRRLADSRRCDVERGDLTGIDDAVFLPGGGMAYACGELRIADRAGDRQLEPPGAFARNLAVSAARAFTPRLYWTVSTPAGDEVRSLVLTPVAGSSSLALKRKI